MSFWSPVERFARAGWRGAREELIRPVREAAAEEAAKEARKEARRTTLTVAGIAAAALGVFFLGRRDRRSERK